MLFRNRFQKGSRNQGAAFRRAALRYVSSLLAVWAILAVGAPFQALEAERGAWLQTATAGCEAPRGCTSDEEPVLKDRARQPGKPGSGTSTEDSSLFISAAAVLRSNAEGRPQTLLDVRSTQDFNTFRIPGSLSVPFSAVWTKGFLRSGRVVLVHSGYRCELLVKACRGLRAAGFDVAILAGGLPQWRRSGGPLEGDAVAIQEMTKISPKIFYEAQQDGSWVVVDVSATAGSIRNLLPQGRSILSIAEPTALRTELARITGGDSGNPCLRVLLVSENGEYPVDLLRAVDQTVSVNVFHLAGGLAAYRDYLNLQSKVLQPRPPEQMKWKRCNSCP